MSLVEVHQAVLGGAHPITLCYYLIVAAFKNAENRAYFNFDPGTRAAAHS